MAEKQSGQAEVSAKNKNEVSAQVKKFGATVRAEAKIFGDSLTDLIDNIVATGKADATKVEQIVYTNAIAAMKVTLQSAMRRWAVVKDAETGEESLVKDPATIQAKVDSWIPGVVERTKKSTEDKMRDYYSGLDTDAQAEFLKSLQEKANA